MKNQFRSLDEDEVEFLDSMLESTRAKEAEVKKQTIEQLSAFKRQQEEAERTANQQANVDMPETIEAWTAGPRKRKKGRESTIGGVKLRKSSTTGKQPTGSATEALEVQPTSLKDSVVEVQESSRGTKPLVEATSPVPVPKAADGDAPASKPAPPSTAGLGLVGYSSDEDD